VTEHPKENKMASQVATELVSALIVGSVAVVAFLALILPLVLGLFERRR
jgi:hypothetical protein